jgi:hypothetical protein
VHSESIWSARLWSQSVLRPEDVSIHLENIVLVLHWHAFTYARGANDRWSRTAQPGIRDERTGSPRAYIKSLLSTSSTGSLNSIRGLFDGTGHSDVHSFFMCPGQSDHLGNYVQLARTQPRCRLYSSTEQLNSEHEQFSKSSVFTWERACAQNS